VTEYAAIIGAFLGFFAGIVIGFCAGVLYVPMREPSGPPPSDVQ